jgi:hypothetical protein
MTLKALETQLLFLSNDEKAQAIRRCRIKG